MRYFYQSIALFVLLLGNTPFMVAQSLTKPIAHLVTLDEAGQAIETTPVYSSISLKEALAELQWQPISIQSNPLQKSTYTKKDPDLALLFSFLLVGGGQIYAGETKKGLMLLGIAIASPVVGWTMASVTGTLIPLSIGYLGSVGAWIYGMATARDVANAYNKKHGFSIQIQSTPLINNLGYVAKRNTPLLGFTRRF